MFLSQFLSLFRLFRRWEGLVIWLLAFAFAPSLASVPEKNIGLKGEVDPALIFGEGAKSPLSEKPPAKNQAPAFFQWLLESPAPLSESLIPPVPFQQFLELDSSLSLRGNGLLKSPYKWSVEIPYAELGLSIPFSKSHLFKMEFDFSYQSKIWNYSVDHFSIRHNFLWDTFFSLEAGYFSHPVSWTSENLTVFSKKTVAQKSLFPYGRRAMGVVLDWRLSQPLYGQISLQANLNRREIDFTQKLERRPALTASLIYKPPGQRLFVSYFQKDFFLEGRMRSWGGGSDLSFEIEPLFLAFRGEFWRIQRAEPHQKLLTGYLFPFFRWGKISFGALFGWAYHYLKEDQSYTLEYILKGDFYLTESLFLSIERIKELDSIIKEDAWSFSLKTKFKV